MKKILIVFSIIFHLSSSVYAQEYKLEKIVDGLDEPWSLSFIDDENILFTEKPGKLYSLNLKNKKISEIKHNLKVLEYGQGGLLDVLYNDNNVYISYTENRGNWTTSTSVGKGKLNQSNIKFNNIFRAEPAIDSKYHFGSRLVIKDKYIFITAGERGQGMIAQDPTKHPGSIIRINTDGSIPKDNPKFIDKKDWLPEIFQIGVRNPQGLTLSPFDQKIYASNHGARGGDWFGEIKKGENYGWKILGWGGTNYSGTKIGPKWLPGYTKAIKYWVPSIATSAITIYKGEEFKEWNGHALITSLKDMSLRKLDFSNLENVKEEVIFKREIGRIRDIQVHPDNGKIYFLSQDALWLMQKN